MAITLSEYTDRDRHVSGAAFLQEYAWFRKILTPCEMRDR